MRQRDIQSELNEASTTLAIFMESYNKSIPLNFPQASVKALRQFQTTFPVLFKNGDQWSIDRHRKKLMDWLSSYRAVA
ncbi:MAG: hypothetical protein A3C84_00635 [Candidatus Ryanbacteria bacterium RIFCSPHIGHO2_02_FULL_48_12]|jgi:hypothetical protein|uniref:Uncharacterized protein n=1 Tax=Candidatus Ryanbacteria bacterium RIFCSPHIGHO2_01_FULL_48_27 TaxID=1802115 RepID=A0A1G2G6E0_9BACT|nr:MAG: hypothetical protein A2756_02555 [Candidatus Ryanbacteria bacterium RIFCSPHIGHO2_01_FULL_48_27]OGZ49291.1 MAG: hypothetical protein A3C84_00635 [Candidatus Ryanbacteria bacterium RIFCSPHIGHO2_02_FULL_48_12]